MTTSEPDPYWKALGERAGELAPGEHRDSVPADRFDAAAWAEARLELDSLDRLVVETGKEHDYAEDFFADLFNLAIKGDPSIRPAAEMATTHLPIRAMVEHFARYPEFQALHQHTIASVYGSAMALLSMSTEIEQAYQRMEAARELAEQAAAALAEAAQMATEAAQMALDGDVDTEEALARAEAAALAAKDAQDTAEHGAHAAAVLGTHALRSGARQAAEDAQREAALMAAFGVEPGKLERMPFAERLALSRQLKNNRMAAFADLIGAFRSMARAELRKKVTDNASEIAGVQLGDDLTRLVPSELVNLATPETEDDFWWRYTQRQLLTWRLSGTERLGKGPIILVCDESESMSADDMGGATREAWSKGFALALTEAARRDNRDCFYIGFSSADQQWQIDLSPKVAGINELITFTEHFYRGGTHYETPLQMALDLAVDYGRHGSARPDIVFITDDQYRRPDLGFLTRWREAKDEYGLRCFGIYIGTGDRPSGALGTLADDVRSISSLAHDVDHVADIFRAL